MKCPKCNEIDHEHCSTHVTKLGSWLSENSFSTHTHSEKKNSVVWMVASSLLVAISVMEWLILGSDSIISIIWNVIMFVGFMADWYKFQDDTVINRIKPYFFHGPHDGDGLFCGNHVVLYIRMGRQNINACHISINVFVVQKTKEVNP